jgi:parallel beta-helix repeat protein
MKRTVSALTLISMLSVSLFYGLSIHSVEADATATIYIRADGSVEGTDKIHRDGDVYTLTGNIPSGIRVQKSYIVIEGAGYAIEGSGEEVGIDLSANYSLQSPIYVNNVTVKNLRIVNCYYGISNENTDNNTFIGNYIADCDTAVWITGSQNNTLTYNMIKDCITGISINYGSGGNVITENNMINDRGSSVLVWLSPEPTVDRNYWSDYLTRYPNAKEIGNSGIWDTPYNYGGSLGNFTDNHPLVEPVPVIPESPDDAGEIEPFPTTLFIVSVASLTLAVIALLVYFKKRKR